MGSSQLRVQIPVRLWPRFNHQRVSCYLKQKNTNNKKLFNLNEWSDVRFEGTTNIGTTQGSIPRKKYVPSLVSFCLFLSFSQRNEKYSIKCNYIKLSFCGTVVAFTWR